MSWPYGFAYVIIDGVVFSPATAKAAAEREALDVAAALLGCSPEEVQASIDAGSRPGEHVHVAIGDLGWGEPEQEDMDPRERAMAAKQARGTGPTKVLNRRRRTI